MTVRKKSIKQEKKVAEFLGGRPVMASGALWFAKGDVETEWFLIECKTTSKDYYPFKKTEWEKIRKESIREGKDPLFVISFEDKYTYAVMPRFVFDMGYRDKDSREILVTKFKGDKQVRVKHKDLIGVPPKTYEKPFYYASEILMEEPLVIVPIDDLGRMITKMEEDLDV